MTYVMLVDSNRSLQDTGCHEQTESKQYTDATEHNIQITSIHADTEDNALVDTEIFKFNKCDIPLFVALAFMVGRQGIYGGICGCCCRWHCGDNWKQLTW
eukprot:944361_1